MKRGASLLLAALLLLSLAGCGGVPEEEYNAVCAERDALQADLNDLATIFFNLRYSVLREAGEGDTGLESVDFTVELLE